MELAVSALVGAFIGLMFIVSMRDNLHLHTEAFPYIGGAGLVLSLIGAVPDWWWIVYIGVAVMMASFVCWTYTEFRPKPKEPVRAYEPPAPPPPIRESAEEKLNAILDKNRR